MNEERPRKMVSTRSPNRGGRIPNLVKRSAIHGKAEDVVTRVPYIYSVMSNARRSCLVM